MQSLKMLVVEDDIASLELMTEVFSSLDVEVKPVSDGRYAANLIVVERYDGIVLDLQMPNINGFDLTQKVRQSSRNKSTPIIVVTGHNDRNAMREAFATGATFFLQKPVDRQKLTNLLRTVRGTLLENRRKYMRVPLQTDVICTANYRTSHGWTWNLSQGGLQIENPELKVGDNVRLSFALPGSGVLIEAFGEVLWADRDRRGIRFASMTSQCAEEIRKLIAQLESPEERVH